MWQNAAAAVVHQRSHESPYYFISLFWSGNNRTTRTKDHYYTPCQNHEVKPKHSNRSGFWDVALKFQHIIRPQVRCQACCACSVVSLAVKIEMLNESKNGQRIANISATHGEVTILAVTWSSNIQWNGMSKRACQWKTNKSFLWRMNLLKLLICDLLSSQKGEWRLA
jgi:hypothetical protein